MRGSWCAWYGSVDGFVCCVATSLDGAIEALCGRVGKRLDFSSAAEREVRPMRIIKPHDKQVGKPVGKPGQKRVAVPGAVKGPYRIIDNGERSAVRMLAVKCIHCGARNSILASTWHTYKDDPGHCKNCHPNGEYGKRRKQCKG
jgi:hypothetical protein